MLRAVAVASCAALLVTGTATSAGADSPPAFSVHPAYGPVGTTLTLTGADFDSETTITVNGVIADDIMHVTSHRMTGVVPVGATSGRVVVSGSSTMTGPTYTVQQTTHGTSTLSKHRLTYTHPLVVTGTETMTGTHAPVVHQAAVLEHLAAGSRVWRHAKGMPVRMTSHGGNVRWKLTPAANGRYRVHFRGTRKFQRATTRAQKLKVGPRLHVRGIHTVPELSRSTIHGSIRPRLDGSVLLQERVNSAWKTVRRTSVDDGLYSFDISPSTLGRLTYRVVRRHDSTHAPATSRTVRVQVVHRTLHLDASGADVRALQKRLRHLHYFVGSVNGSYGWDTLHAVTAFQKVQGLHPDGDTGPQVWRALNHPKKIHLKYPTAGTYSVEVDIAKEVLLLGKDGHVTHILDTSTAGGYLYTNSEGGTSRAVTPRGHFTIQYKLTGWHKSKLGELYYPSYFTTTGYAIHGEGDGNDYGEVPPVPASHGCVRITNDAVLQFFSSPWLAVGTSVWVYG